MALVSAGSNGQTQDQPVEKKKTDKKKTGG